MRLRKLLQVAVLAPALLAGAVPPAEAQIMKRDGFTLPWFRSAGERRAREACANNQPDCRPAVRQQMDEEKAISLLFPWLVLGLLVLGVLLYLRKREREKIKHRRQAQHRHDPKAYKKLDQTKEDRAAETAAPDDF